MDQPKRAKSLKLPWSNGLLSAKLWHRNNRVVVGVPELGLHCYGNSDSEAAFRLFYTLLQYHQQLRAHPRKLSKKGQEHLRLLNIWFKSVEERIMGVACISR
jgi:hypothetical protein